MPWWGWIAITGIVLVDRLLELWVSTRKPPSSKAS